MLNDHRSKESSVPSANPLRWSHRAKLVTAFAVLYVVWGSTYLAIRIGLNAHMPPALFAGSRLVPAGLLLLAFARATGSDIRIRARDLRIVATVGIILLVGGMFSVFVAEQYIPSSLAALMIALQPVWIACAESVLPGMDRPSGLGYLGLALGFAGLGILMYPRIAGIQGTSQELTGCIIVISATLLWMVGSVYSKRRPVAVDALVASGYEMLSAGLVLLVLSVFRQEWPVLLSGRIEWLAAVGALLYLIVFGSAIAFTAFVWLLKYVPASKVMTYAFVNPVIAVFLGWMLLREPLDWWVAGGMTVIVSGVALTTLAPTRPGSRHTTMADEIEGPAEA
jgi:drug/metabolite transporter (DMT)-like permease